MKKITLALFLFPIYAHAQIITTIAGNGSWGGDSGPATAAYFDQPNGVAVDKAGNVYIADAFNNRVRKINTAGIITTIAGNGFGEASGTTGGFSGDGGPATAAELRFPMSVAVDNSGNLYIADYANSRIRKVDASGFITTFAGNYVVGYSGDGGIASNASLNEPKGVSVDNNGNVYIADYGNNRVRMVNTSGIITSIAGTGGGGYDGDRGKAATAMLHSPTGVAVDNSGNIYIADEGNNRIRKISTSDTITTVAGTGTSGYAGDGGAAATAELSSPSGVVVDNAGNIYVSDLLNSRVRKINSSGIINTIAGKDTSGFSGDGGAAIAAKLNTPSGLAIDSAGDIYIADPNNADIRKVNTAGKISSIAGNNQFCFKGDGGSAIAAELFLPSSVATDKSGNIYVADQGNNRIRKIDLSGRITTIAGNDSLGYRGDGRPAATAYFRYPYGIATDNTGNIYIADAENNRIRKIDVSGMVSTIAGTGAGAPDMGAYGGDNGPAIAASLYYPTCVAVDRTGNIYIADEYNNRIRKVDASGMITTVAGGGSTGTGDDGAATAAELSYPTQVALDSAGNIYIADQGNDRIRKVDATGRIITVAGGGTWNLGDGGPATAAELSNPTGVAVDDRGIIYIADNGNNRIRMVNTSGTITTLSGNGVFGYGGDGNIASMAELAEPNEISVDEEGNIYVADTYNNRVRKISAVTGINPAIPISSVVAIYPNPATSELTIVCQDDITSIVINNLIGQTEEMQILSSTSKSLHINVSDLPAGIYLARINETEVRKFVKE